jgi:hypothetical protein
LKLDLIGFRNLSINAVNFKMAGVSKNRCINF